ncbi:hypothetical protein RHMOL_Rhmol05G0228000 [Rhododendron molle]|uniref:Uncharacterized protein n=1 Tax=Rhododendron molle TaxID=49168 RepID=A0ACC0NS65_RHOML|nr:hypothetical protein RHMOL_Rhmol05G0228000 [Rhododendron molle]
MVFDTRDPEEKMASFSPWKRGRPESWGPCQIVRHSFWEEFDTRTYANMDLDIDTKRAATKASPFVVSLVSLSGGKPLFMGSGTIVDCEEANGAHLSTSTILTSASLFRTSAESDALPNDIKVDVYLSDGTLLDGQVYACDFHYNLALVKIESDALLQPASLRNLDDSISIHPCEIQSGTGSESFQLRPHSDLFHLCPGDKVVALGRYFEEPHEIMAAPGKFRRFCRHWLGMQMTNLCAARLGQLEKIIQKFPNVSKGVLVEKVMEGSPAERAGILDGDVIVRCARNKVTSFLEFCGIIWDKTAGKSAKLVVIRATSGGRLKLKVKLEETGPDKVYRWPLPEKCMVAVKRVRM